MTDDFGLPGPIHARRRDALRQYAGDVAAIAAADAMPPRKRTAKGERDDGWVQGLDKARRRVRTAERRMGEACHKIARRVACLGQSREQAARDLGYLEHCGSLADAVRQVGWMLVLAGDACMAAYEVREAA